MLFYDRQAVVPDRFSQTGILHPLLNFIGLALLTGLLLIPQPVQAGPHWQTNNIGQLCFAVADETTTDHADTLVSLNLSTAATSIVGATGTTGIEAIAFTLNGELLAADEGQLGTLDLTTGQFTAHVQPFGTGGGSEGEISLNSVDSLSLDRASNQLYGVHRIGQGAADLLFAIDQTTGAHIPNFFGTDIDYVPVEIITDDQNRVLDNVDDIAIDPGDGTMYAAINRSGTGGVLGIIDPTTGNVTQQATFRYPTPNPSAPALAGQVVDDVEGLSFHPSGQLYGSTGANGPDAVDLNKLFRIDKATGESSEVGPFPADLKDYEALACLTGLAAISLEKSTNGPGQPPADADTPTGPAIDAGAPVTWTYVIQNTGALTLTDLVLNDNQLGAIGPGGASNCPAPGASLAPGAELVCVATGSAQAGQYANTAVVTGTTPVGLVTPRQTVSDTDPSHYFGLDPAIDIEKATNGQDADTPTGPLVEVGSTVNWTYVVSNTGNVTLTNVTVTDNQGVTVSCPQDSLIAGESMTCTASGTATAGQYANLGTVTGTPPVGNDVSDSDPSHYFGAVPGISIEKATNGEDADNPTGPFVPVGDPVNWTYVVSNTGNVTLTNVSVTDDQGVTVTCPQTTLAVGEGMTCTASGAASAGQYANVGSVTGTPPLGNDVSDTDPSHYFGAEPGIDIEKATNGEDADDPTGPFIPLGAPVNWSYLVRNTGNVALTNVTVTDDQGVTVTCPQDTLNPGESMTCTASGTASAGQYANVGSVTGTPPVGNDVNDTDPSHYFGSDAGIVIEKATNGEDADDPTGPFIPLGAAVNWTYVVTNTGIVALTNVTVTDDQGVAVSCPQSTLNPGESMTCTASGTASAGQYANVGSVTGTPPVGNDVSDSDPSHYFGSDPSIDIEKATNGVDADDPTGPVIPVGDPVNWTYRVENTGIVALTNVTVSDDQGVTVTCPQDSLNPGASMTCTASGTATAGQYANVGSVTGTPPVGNDVSDSDPSHYFGSVAGITIEKATNGQDADDPTGPIVEPGSTVQWTYVVQNIGNVTLNNVTVTDDQGVTVSCPQDSLIAGESMTCTASGTATVGQYANVGSVTGTPPSGDPVQDDDPSHYLGADPGISLEKATNGQDADNPTGPFVPVGNPVNWSYVVENTGNVPLSNITVSDDQGVAVSCPQTSLAPGQSMTCAASGAATAGQYANVGTVTGTPPVGDNVSDTDPSHYFGSAPSISLEKATNGQDADTPTGPFVPVGDAVNWSYVVENTGNVVLTDITVSDDQGVSVNCPQDTLNPGESMTCTASGNAAAGQYANVGSVTGTPPVGNPVGDTDPSHYFGAAPGISIEKTTNGADADNPTGPFVPVGDPITWRYTVQNTGNVLLNNVTVSDDQGVAVSCPQDSLNPGESMTCTASGTATAGQYANVGTASGTPPVGNPVNDTDPSHYFGSDPGITIEKTTNGQDADTPTGPAVTPGSTVQWTYVVENTGNVLLNNVTVTDDQGVAVSCPQDSLNPGESMTCTASGTATAGQYANVGTATGTPPGGDPVQDDDPSHYLGAEPGISIEKATNGADADTPTGPVVTPGSTVQWTYVVENTGNVLLNNVTVTDDQGVAVSCPQDSLTPGESMTCTASGTATAGQYANVGTASGTPPVGNPVNDTDPSHYFGSDAGISIEKTTNGQDADDPTGPLVPVGAPVTWSYVVENTGNVALTGITVSDNQGVTVSCPQDSLSAGESMTCTASGTATAGQYANVGTVTGTPPDGEPVQDDDPSHYFGAVPAIEIEKTPDQQTIVRGTTVTFTIEVRNTGNVPLVNVVVTDALAPDCDNNIGDLAVGAQTSYTCALANVTADFTNVAVVTGEDEADTPVTDEDAADVEVIGPPSLLVRKEATLDTQVLQPGSVISYTITYSNTGEAPATGVFVTENVPETTTFSPARSSAGWVCEGGAVTAGTACRFDVGTLPAGQAGSLLFVVTLNGPLGDTRVISNRVEIGGDNIVIGTDDEVVVVEGPSNLPPAEQPQTPEQENTLHLPLVGTAP